MKITSEELQLILANHLKWIDGEAGGARADLSGADLRGADLSGADLRGAKLRGALLSSTDIHAIKNIGSRGGTTYYHVSTDSVICGCFSGTLEEFETKVKKTHSAGSVALAQYIAAIVFFRTIKEAKQNENHNSEADNLAEVKGVASEAEG